VRVLLVSFYFPPAGGAGVQRPLKFAEQLRELGFEVSILAPDDPKWIHRDPALPLPTGVPVKRARYLGPRGRLPGYELHGRDRLGRALLHAELLPRRSLVPDENVPWLLTAVPAAVRIVRREQIDVLLTTSPPASVHLLGALVKRLTGVRWIADVRDSLLAKEDRAIERRAARAKELLQQRVGRLVARSADGVVAVTETIASELRSFNPRLRLAVIPNGCDFDDFVGLPYTPSPRLRLTHAGSFLGKRDPRPVLRALKLLPDEVQLRFVGDFRPADREFALSLNLGDRLELRPYAPRSEVLAAERDSEMLLLLLPEIGARGRDIPSGKLYEYLAARRPILACVPPDGSAAALINEAGAGTVVPPDDTDAIAAALGDYLARWRESGLSDIELPDQLARRLSRDARTQELAEFLRSFQ
jgi:glycosyltransferase involved in cell wall biosynthesis